LLRKKGAPGDRSGAESFCNLHANPVEGKLVEHPKDRPWSSWSFYAQGKSGLVKIDPMD